MQKFVSVEGIVVRYADFGVGDRVVVVLHGYLEAIEIWEDFCSLLGKSYRVIVVDLPGHGMSQYPQSEDSLDAIGEQFLTPKYMARIVGSVLAKLQNVDEFFVVGHSMGGYVALELAAQNPIKTKGIILLHSSPLADSPKRKENRQREINLIKAGKKEALVATNFLSKGFAQSNKQKMTDAIFDLQEQAMMMDDKALVLTLEGIMRREDMSEFFKNFKGEKLMVFADQDNFLPKETAELLIQKFPESKFTWVENSGHHSFLEQPKELLGIIDGFSQGLKWG